MTLFVNWHHAMRGNEETSANLLAKLNEVLDQLVAQHGHWQVPYGEITGLQRTTTEGSSPMVPPKFDDSPSSIPVAGVSGYDGAVFTFNAIPFTMAQEKRRFGVHGDSYVSVVDFAPKTRPMSVVTFGASADPNSPHYFDQAQLYARREFKPAWFTREEVKQNARSAYHPGGEKPRQ